MLIRRSTATPTRLASITYPNGRVLTYGYDTGADSAVGRVSYLADSDGTQLADYSYLGLEPDRRREQSPQPGIDLISATRTPMATWTASISSTAPRTWFSRKPAGNIDEIMQGYDVSGNELWQAQPTAASYGVSLDELYGYNAAERIDQRHPRHAQ